MFLMKQHTGNHFPKTDILYCTTKKYVRRKRANIVRQEVAKLQVKWCTVIQIMGDF